MLAPLLNVFLQVFNAVVDFYWIVVIVAVVASWLVAFGVINTYNHAARLVLRMLDAVTEPVFRPIRRLLPAMGGLDLSPMIVLLVLWVLQSLVNQYGQMALVSMYR